MGAFRFNPTHAKSPNVSIELLLNFFVAFVAFCSKKGLRHAPAVRPS